MDCGPVHVAHEKTTACAVVFSWSGQREFHSLRLVVRGAAHRPARRRAGLSHPSIPSTPAKQRKVPHRVGHFSLVGPEGIEPSTRPPQGRVLPLYYGPSSPHRCKLKDPSGTVKFWLFPVGPCPAVLRKARRTRCSSPSPPFQENPGTRRRGRRWVAGIRWQPPR